MNQPKKREGPSMRIKTSTFQAIPMAAEDKKEPCTIATARRSSIEAKGMCAVCGIRMNRDDLEACSHCGSPLCAECKRQGQRKAKKTAAARLLQP